MSKIKNAECLQKQNPVLILIIDIIAESSCKTSDFVRLVRHMRFHFQS